MKKVLFISSFKQMKHKIFLSHCLILIIIFFAFDFAISKILIIGLNKYYGFSQKPEILINGSSMAMAGFNREQISSTTKMQIASYTQEGASVKDRYIMINHFFKMFPNDVKLVIYEVNPVLFSNICTAENVYTNFYPYLDDKTIDMYIKTNADVKEYYLNKIIRTKRFDARLLRLIMKGYLDKFENLKTNVLDTTNLVSLSSQRDKTEILMDPQNIEIFEKTVDLIKFHNSEVLLIMMPIYSKKLKTFKNENYMTFTKYFKDYSYAKDSVSFLDLNLDSLAGNAVYFSDPLHFNVYGQQVVSKIVSAYLIDN